MCNYWIYIEPYVYISIRGNSAILYNTLNYKSLIINSKKIVSILRKIDRKDNLRVVGISSLSTKDSTIEKFISNIKKFYFGDIIPCQNSSLKPIQFVPLTNVKSDIKKLQANFGSLAGEYISSNLYELDIYINSIYDRDYPFLKYAYKQFSVNYQDNSIQEMNFAVFEEIIKMTRQTAVNKINIFGGNIFSHSSIAEIVNNLERSLKSIEYNFFIDDIINTKLIQTFNKSSSVLNVWLYYPDKWNECNFRILKSIGHKIQYQFIVDDIKQFNYYLNVIDEFSLEDFYFNPIYTGNNHDFFNKNFLINKSDLLRVEEPMIEFQKRSMVNSLYFGKLTIMNNGDVYTNLNFKDIGNINKNLFPELVAKELLIGNCWRKTRFNVKPCNKCIFNFLCPPISSYNFYLNKYNLCNIESSN